MKYIREVSDIHLDHDIEMWHQGPLKKITPSDMDLLWYPEPMEGDDDTCLILAGDLWTERRFISRKHPHTGKRWIEEVAARFKYVVFVLGNHDYWNQNFQSEPGRVKMALNDLKTIGLCQNVFFLEKSTLVLDQVKFVGGTLWTDYNNGDPMVLLRASNAMNDYRYIRSGLGYSKLKPQQVLGIHAQTRNYIFENLKRDDDDQKIVVVTHHPPSPRSYQNYHGPDFIWLYSTDLEAWIMEHDGDIDYWFHGHVHIPSDYNIGQARIIANPRGYSGSRPTGWDPFWRLEL